MKAAVFHGGSRNGNTHAATKIFLNEIAKCGDAHIEEFFLHEAAPGFCTGCAVCMSGGYERCPHAKQLAPLLEAIKTSEALVFTTPHYGACAMSGAMKSLLDHLGFLVMNVAPMPEIFEKKAMIITTGAGSSAAIRPIKSFLNHWGVNRVYSLGFKMFTDKWEKVEAKRLIKFEKKIKRAARKFYFLRKHPARLSVIFYFYVSRFIVKKFIGPGNYPYEYWARSGFFAKRPF